MFEARGYTLIQETADDDGYILKGSGNTMLYITSVSKINMDVLKHYHSLFKNANCTHGILVYDGIITSSTKKIIPVLDIRIETFHTDELSYNVLKHVWVPRHIKIDHKKRNDEKYPVLRKTDPVAKFLGFNTGDVIMIHRNDNSIYYRYVK